MRTDFTARGFLFDGTTEWNIGNETGRNVIIFEKYNNNSK